VGLGKPALEDLVTAAPVSIDVAVCTYNNARLLDEALEALVAQHARSADWRILVVDNNCTDDTPEVVARRAAESPVPLTVVREPEQGLTPARRRAVRETSGDWIAFVDDDCLVAPDWIESAARFARARPDCGGFGGHVVLDWEQPPREYVTRYGWAFAEQDHGDEPKRVEALAGAGFVFRRAALADSGWTERHFLADRVGKKLVSGGDVEMALRVAARHDLWYTPTLRLRHRVPARRTTRRYLLGVTRDLGASQLFADSMLWPGSYARWLLESLLRSRKWAGQIVHFAFAWLLRRGGGNDALMQASFLSGWLAGIWRLSRMPSADRRAVLGLAVGPRR
jgi:glycosyltransferase involved in cell wall biosynthesis